MKAQVLLPKIFNFPFTYSSKVKTKIGDLVEVPFGSKKELGVIWKNKFTEPKNIKIKNISKKTDYSIKNTLRTRSCVKSVEWFICCPCGSTTTQRNSFTIKELRFFVLLWKISYLFYKS